MPLIIFAYNLIMLMALCFLGPICIPLVVSREKRRHTVFNRLFMKRIASPRQHFPADGNRGRIWIHALSVGEVLSAETLVKAMAEAFGRENLIFTASTHTGFQTARRVIAPYVGALRHFPYDSIISVNRAMALIRPRQVVIVETDIWPNFLYRLKKSNVPVYLVNARLSDRSYRGYRRIGFVMKPLLSVFGRICVQTDADAQRFRNLGVPEPHIVTVGNIKFDQPPIDVESEEIKRLSQQIRLPSGASVWVAGSTHDGEEDLLAEAYRKIHIAGKDPVLIIAPRDPARAVAVYRQLQRHGLAAITLSMLENQPHDWRVLVIDRIGLLRKLYLLSDVAFVGGSLVKAGGHNPLEPASVAKPILFGPHTDDFRWISRRLEDAGGAFRVFNSDQIARTVGDLISDKAANRKVGRNAQTVFFRHQGAVRRTMAVLAAADEAGGRTS